MDFLKLLSFVSPVAGAATGQGIGKILPYISPAYGMATGKGFGAILGGHDPVNIQSQPLTQPSAPNYAQFANLPNPVPQGGGTMGNIGHALMQSGQQDSGAGLDAYSPIHSSALAYLQNYLGQL